MCRHGTKVFRSKLSAKTGELWYAWACPGPYNGDSCTREEGGYEFHNPPGRGVEAPEWSKN